MKRYILPLIVFYCCSFGSIAQQKIKDIYQGNESSEPRDMVNASSKNFFLDKQNKLYVTDGTEAGTLLLTDPEDDNFIFPQITSRYFSSVGDKMLFSAYQTNAYAGNELWVSDGTVAGTFELKDIYPGATSSNPSAYIKISDSLTIFLANSGDNELWITDGTSEGTHIFYDFYPGEDLDFSLSFTHGETFFFGVSDGYSSPTAFWMSDGTEDGTILLDSNLQASESFALLGSDYIFSGYQADTGSELWKTDGTVAGTFMFKELLPGYLSSNLKYFTELNSKVYFAGRATSNDEIWMTDGTEAGTVILKKINPYSTSSPQHLTRFNNNIYFTATDGTTGQELYKTDGTESGTVLLKDINPTSTSRDNLTFPSGSDSPFIGSVNGFLFFLANDGTNGMELWRTDGTEVGTIMIDNINQSAQESDIKNITVLSNEILFNAQKLDGTYELFTTDGNTIQPFLSKYGISSLSKPYILGESQSGDLFFTAFSPSYGYELFKLSSNVISLVKDILTEPTEEYLSYDREAFVATTEDKAYFLRDDNEHGVELWSTDGTEANTKRLSDLDPYPVYIPTSSSFSYKGSTIPGLNKYINHENKVFFSHLDEIFKVENDSLMVFWTSTNGTSISKLSSVGNGLQWIVRDSLYSYNGSSISSHYIDANNYSNPLSLDIVDIGNMSLFFYPSSLYGKELYSFNHQNSTAALVKNLTSGTSNSQAKEFVKSGNMAFFTLNNFLYVSDGTSSGTFKIETNAGVPYSVYKLRSLDNGLITFTADDGTHGQEVWVSDGTLAGTKMIEDLNEGSGKSIYNQSALNLNIFSVSNGKTWFSALGHIYSTDGITIDLEVEDVSLNDIYAYQGRVFNSYYTGAAAGREPISAAKNSYKLIGDIYPGSEASEANSFIAIDSKLFFFAKDSSGIYAPYIYEFCPSEILLNSPQEESTTYQSQYAIEGLEENIIKTNQNVTYSSHGYVLLKPGFETESGAVFKTETTGCTE